MKRTNLHPLTLALFSILTTFIFMGCQQDAYKPTQKEEATANSFDFSTTSFIQLDVKYDVPQGYKVQFEVYLENPFNTNEEGQVVKRTDITPVIIRMTDGKGEYYAKEVITADHGSEAYIYTSYIGVPTLFKTNIKDRAITAHVKWESTATTRQTRAAATAAPEGYYTLGKWNELGRPDYLDSEGKLTLSTSIMNTINKTLPESGTCPERYRQSVDFKINDPQGRKAEVSVRLVGGTSGAASMFGYYCYQDGASKKEIEAAKKVIIFPNTITMKYNKPIALQGGECVKLHYFNEAGQDKGTVFPNGIRIGWFLLNDAFVKSGVGYGAFYSTPQLNSKKRTQTAAFRINDFMVLSFEDWTDNDYNDVMFNIWSNPIEAIITPEVPTVKPEEGEPSDNSVAYRMTYKGILAYEDSWPSQGDYDMNDVVVKYNSILSFNTKNEVLSTEDTFTALWTGALYRNGFSYQLNTDRSNVTTEFAGKTVLGQGLDNELTKATINVFIDARTETDDNKKTPLYSIKNFFKAPINHETFGVAPYNPFITVNGRLGNARTEVHLVNHRPTEKMTTSLFNTGNDLSNPTKDLFFVAAENYPFAIHMVDAASFNSEEKEPIDKTYPKFIDWVKSNGTQHKDWYK